MSKQAQRKQPDKNPYTGLARKCDQTRYWWVLCHILLLLWLTMPQSLAQSGTPTLACRLTKPSTPLNGQVELLLEIQNVQNFYGYELTLNYDPTLVEILDGDPNRAQVNAQLGDFLSLDFLMLNEINEPGALLLNLMQINPTAPRSGNGLLARVALVARKGGTATFTLKDVLLYDSNGTEIAHEDKNCTLRIDGSSIATATASPTVTPSATPTATSTSQPTATASPTVTPSATPTATSTPQPTATASPTVVPTSALPTVTPSPQPVFSPTATFTPLPPPSAADSSATPSPTALEQMAIALDTPTATATALPILPTATAAMTPDNQARAPMPPTEVPPTEVPPTAPPTTVASTPTLFTLPTPTAIPASPVAANTPRTGQSQQAGQGQAAPVNPAVVVNSSTPSAPLISLYLFFFFFGAFVVFAIGFGLLLVVVYMFFARVQTPYPHLLVYPPRRLRRRRVYFDPTTRGT